MDVCVCAEGNKHFPTFAKSTNRGLLSETALAGAW